MSITFSKSKVAIGAALVTCLISVHAYAAPPEDVVEGGGGTEASQPINTESYATDRAFTFGKDYCRISLEYLYLPTKRYRDSSFIITIGTPNKSANSEEPLTFRYAYEPEAGKFLSAMGQKLVVPRVALNIREPLTVRGELRTRRNVSQQVGQVQQLLGLVANVATGGLASTISSVTNYANTANKVVQGYENQTEISDGNEGLILEKSLQRIRVSKDGDAQNEGMYFLMTFSRGEGRFRVVRPGDSKKVMRISEPFIQGVQPIYNLDRKTLYAFQLKEQQDPGNGARASSPPLSIRGNIRALLSTGLGGFGNTVGLRQSWVDSASTADWVYPTGDDAYAVIKVEAYRPYERLEEYPEQVRNDSIIGHFSTQRELLEANETVLRGNDSEGKKTAHKLLDAEGAKLIANLYTLTKAGDISNDDAHTLVAAFIKRVKESDSAYPTTMLERRCQVFGSHMAPISAPGPIPIPSP